jgi:hypothetical protein
VKRTLPVALLILVGSVVLCFAEDPRDELYDELSTSLAQAEALVAGMAVSGETSITGEQLESLVFLNRQIRGSLYSDLIDRSDLLVLLARDQMNLDRDPQQLELRMEEILQDSRRDARNLEKAAAREKVLRTSFNTTLISFASAFTLWGLAELQDRRYFQASSIEEATLRRRLFQIFSIGSLVGAAVGVVGAGVSVALYAGTR